MSAKRVLFIAFHYPPVAYSSGVHRTLAFTRELASKNWDVAVLTANESCYQTVDKTQKSEIPASVKVISAWAKDAVRDLSYKGKYFKFMSIPDRYQTWVLGGFISGLLHIIKHKPAVIISTYPVASAHLIGYLLHKITKTPWIADFRDPMAQDNFPSDQTLNRAYRFIERLVFRNASYFIFVTESARRYYLKRFPLVDASNFLVIPNGFDEHFFKQAALIQLSNNHVNLSKVIFLHSGLIYPSERDPTCFFAALSKLKVDEVINCNNFLLRLRATGHDVHVNSLITQFDIADIVEVCAPIAHTAALIEMFQVDVLVLLQAENSNDQIPAKAYEYIRARKPILALTSPNGETAGLVSESGAGIVVPLNDLAKIIEAIKLMMLRENHSKLCRSINIEKYSRKNGASALEALLNNLIR